MKINVRRPFRVLVSLFLLLALTTVLAFLPLTMWPINLAIAFIMTGLIVLFFMKVRYSEPLIALTSVTGIVWLTILLVLVILDYASRPWPR